MMTFDKLISGLAVSPICPRCKGVIPSEDINVAKDIAYCRNCNLSQSLSALTSGAVVDEDVNLSQPPAGAWFRHDPDVMAVGATNRSLSGAFGMLIFTLFWNGIVGFFVLVAVAETMRHLGISMPSWFPPFMAKSNNSPVGLIVFLWLFLTPFITVGLITFGVFLNCVGGRGEVRVQNGRGVLFTGIGPLGSRKQFEASDVRDVRLEDRSWFDSQGHPCRKAQIIIETGSQSIQFGSMFSDERRRFVAGVLKKELVRR